MSDICTPEFNDQTRKMQERVKALREQLKETQRDATRLAQVEKQSAAYRERIQSGDTSRQTKPEAKPYGEAVQNAIAERNRLRSQVEELLAKGDRLNRTAAQKILGIAHDIGMAAILSSLHVFPKLAYAVLGGHVGSLIADTTRSVAKAIIPGVRRIAEQSPQYGMGLDADALAGRWKGFLEGYKGAKEQLKYGQAMREAVYGNASRMSDEYMTHVGTMSDALKTEGALNKTAEVVRQAAGYVGRTHAAVKEFLAQAEFREAIVRESKSMAAQMKAKGMTPEQIQHVMSQESTMAAIGAKALERAYESKMQGKNALSSGVDAMVGTLDRSKNPFMNALGFLFKRAFPVRKVGVNIAIRQTENLAGGAKALVESMRKGKMTHERADYIMKNIGRQGVGAAMLTAGILYYQHLGGVPGVFKKKEQPEIKDAQGNPVKPGEGEGVPFGTAPFHGAEFALMQIGASMAQVFQKEHGKEKGFDMALDVALKPTMNWFWDTIPYTGQLSRWQKTAAMGRGRTGGMPAAAGQIAGDTIRSSVIPGVVQQYAAAQDPYKGFRRPRNIKEDIEMGIPGLRENVPKR